MRSSSALALPVRGRPEAVAVRGPELRLVPPPGSAATITTGHERWRNESVRHSFDFGKVCLAYWPCGVEKSLPAEWHARAVELGLLYLGPAAP